MNIFIDDEDLIRVDLFVKRCGGNCECGRLLHRLYTAYLIAMKELKKADVEAFKRITENDKNVVGIEQLPSVSECSNKSEEEGTDREE
jgi:hypothetical protein